MIVLHLSNVGQVPTHPQEVAGHKALTVAAACPPPLRLHAVVPPQHRQAVTLSKAELVIMLWRAVPQRIYHTTVHHAHLLLDACLTHTHSL